MVALVMFKRFDAASLYGFLITLATCLFLTASIAQLAICLHHRETCSHGAMPAAAPNLVQIRPLGFL